MIVELVCSVSFAGVLIAGFWLGRAFAGLIYWYCLKVDLICGWLGCDLLGGLCDDGEGFAYMEAWCFRVCWIVDVEVV